jgi:hypothetical protein
MTCSFQVLDLRNLKYLCGRTAGMSRSIFAKVRNPILISADYQILLSFLAND